MSELEQITPCALAPSPAHAVNLTLPSVEETAQSWICAFCGLLRAYEGGRRLGCDDRNECRECGARLAGKPADWAIIANNSGRRGSVRSLIDSALF